MVETDNIKYYVFQQSINNVISQTTLSKFVISDILNQISRQIRNTAYYDLKNDVAKMNNNKEMSNDTKVTNESK